MQEELRAARPRNWLIMLFVCDLVWIVDLWFFNLQLGAVPGLGTLIEVMSPAPVWLRPPVFFVELAVPWWIALVLIEPERRPPAGRSLVSYYVWSLSVFGGGVALGGSTLLALDAIGGMVSLGTGGTLVVGPVLLLLLAALFVILHVGQVVATRIGRNPFKVIRRVWLMCRRRPRDLLITWGLPVMLALTIVGAIGLTILLGAPKLLPFGLSLLLPLPMILQIATLIELMEAESGVLE